MEYTTLGSTGLKVSKLCFGTWGIGGAGWDDNSEEVRLAAIREALESGINFFDTAPAYNGGAAEKLIGKALKESGKRKDCVIVTKCGSDFVDGQYVHDGSGRHIRAQIDRSLQNLQTDYIDVYLLHWPDEDVPVEDTFGALKEIRDAGKVRFIGVCNHSPEELAAAEKICPVDVVQEHFSMLVQDRIPTLSYAAEKGMGTMAYGVLGGGMLTGRYRTLETYDEMDSRGSFYTFFQEPGFSKAMKLLTRLDRIAAECGTSLPELTLRWTMEKDFVTTVLFGAQKAERVRANVKAMSLRLSPEKLAAIDRAIAQEFAAEA